MYMYSYIYTVRCTVQHTVITPVSRLRNLSGPLNVSLCFLFPVEVSVEDCTTLRLQGELQMWELGVSSVRWWSTLPAVPLQAFGLVRAVEELALEKLHGNDSEDEHEEDVDDENIQHVLQRVHHTVEHGLQETPTQR